MKLKEMIILENNLENSNGDSKNLMSKLMKNHMKMRKIIKRELNISQNIILVKKKKICG